VLAGLLTPSASKVLMNDRDVTGLSPRALTALGVGIVPEDRHAVGCHLDLSIAENLFLGQLDRFTRFGLLRRDALAREAARRMEAYDVRAAGPDAPMSSLFNPDVFERPQSAPPLLRPISAITAEWRAQMAASPSTVAPAPIWNRIPFARPARPEAAAPLALDPLPDTALVIAPPIWRRPGASAPDVESLESLGAELPSPASAAPVWGSWLSASDAASAADDARAAQLPAQRLDAPGELASDEQYPPIWSSFLRRE